MSIEAMKQALEKATEVMEAACIRVDELKAENESLRQAIAEAEKQEPKCVVIVEVFGKDWRLEYMSLPVGRHKLYAQQYLYTHPQPNVTTSDIKQEHVAKTAKQRHEWVGLTDEERHHARNAVTYSQLAMTHSEWVEAVQKETEKKLKEKNT